MTRDETVRLLAILRSIWPQEAVTDATLTGWTWAFEDVSYPDAEAAAKAWSKAQKFFPRPSELRALCPQDTFANASAYVEFGRLRRQYQGDWDHDGKVYRCDGKLSTRDRAAYERLASRLTVGAAT